MKNLFIPCPHKDSENHPSNSRTPPPKSFTIKFSHQIVERLFYHDLDDQEFQVYNPVSPRYILPDPFDPFCPSCRTTLVDFVNSRHESVAGQAVLESLTVKVTQLIENPDKDPRFSHGVCINYKIVIRSRPFSEQELLALVSQGDRVGFTPASESAIAALETVKVEELGTRMSQEDGNCVICLENMLAVDDAALKRLLKKLPCQHVFHQDCIIKWLRNSHLCPLCRFEMPVDDSK